MVWVDVCDGTGAHTKSFSCLVAFKTKRQQLAIVKPGTGISNRVSRLAHDTGHLFGDNVHEILKKWINPAYLTFETIEALRQSAMAKPLTRYLVLDNFFNTEALDGLISQHSTLEFSEQLDRYTQDNEKLPYDGSVVFAGSQHVGSELFFNKHWHTYLGYLVGHPDVVNKNEHTFDVEVKLRYHRPDADGFWIHTDGTVRKLVAICYFNKNWAYTDGGLLQLWHPQPPLSRNPFKIDNPSGRLSFLSSSKIIRTSTPGGGWTDSWNGPRDMLLIDQVVPAYNRLFLCTYHNDPAYHSVTPSYGKARTGFVFWLK